MRRAMTPRLLTVAGWCLLAVILGVCAWGLGLTDRQRRDVRGILVDLKRQAAEAQRPALEQFLDTTTRSLLDSVLAAGTDAARLRALRETAPIMADVFGVTEDGQIWFPLLHQTFRRSPLAGEEPPPAEFEAALGVVAGAAPPEEKAQALEEVYESQGMAPRWRLRALATLASIQVSRGDARQALESYRTLEEEFSPLLRSSSQPSYLQIALARAQCSIQAGGLADAGSEVSAALDEIVRGATGATVAEEAFFTVRARILGALLAERGVLEGGALEAFERGLSMATSAVRERRASTVLADALHRSILARGEISKATAVAESRLFSVESPAALRESIDPVAPVGHEGRLLLAVWSGVPPPASANSAAGTVAVVAFRVDVARLESLLKEKLAALVPDGRFEARVSGPSGEDAFLPLTQLSGDRSCIRIGHASEVWEEMVGKAQEPLRLAAVLIIALALLLTLGVVAFLRAVRREVLLARMKTEFVANVSHELKTPLALIRLFGETLLLDRVTDPERRRRYYQIITRESERLAHLIQNVLNFASIEAGKKTYDLCPCDVGELVRETYDSYCYQLEEKGFEHSMHVQEDLPLVVADRDAVAQALINLLENAVKYSTREKRIDVDVREEDGMVKVSVRDRGVGISAADIPRVWEDYYRTREARAMGTRGSGLGLSLVRHIVAAHRGRVDLRSAPGEGSTFSLLFPVLDGPPAREGSAGSGMDNGACPPAGMGSAGPEGRAMTSRQETPGRPGGGSQDRGAS